MAAGTRPDKSLIERLVGSGCAVIEIDPIQADALAEVVAAASLFFQLPGAEKLPCRLGPAAGYRPYGIEYSNAPERPDEMETFSTTAASASQESTLPCEAARNLHRRSVVAFQALEPVAERLTAALAQYVTGRSWEDGLRGGLHRWSCLQVNHSRPREVKSEFINEVHEDGHFLTLAHATSAGLEVLQENREYCKITTSSNQIVVMLGGIASLMTNGQLPPLYHRVRPISISNQRTSILFFADIAPELCQPWIVGEANRAIDIGAKIRANPTRFGLQKYGSE